MKLAAQIVAGIVAAEHLWFLTLEMFLWRKPIGRKTFNTTQEFADASAPMAMNQGLYNGFLSAGIILGLVTDDFRMLAFSLSCVVVAGLFGGATVKWPIAVIQGIPAAIGLGLLVAAR